MLAVGTWLAPSPAIARRILDGGHELGNHTEHHGAIAADERRRRRTAKSTTARTTLRRLTGSAGTWFRPSQTQHATATDPRAGAASRLPDLPVLRRRLARLHRPAGRGRRADTLGRVRGTDRSSACTAATAATIDARSGRSSTGCALADLRAVTMTELVSPMSRRPVAAGRRRSRSALAVGACVHRRHRLKRTSPPSAPDRPRPADAPDARDVPDADRPRPERSTDRTPLPGMPPLLEARRPLRRRPAGRLLARGRRRRRADLRAEPHEQHRVGASTPRPSPVVRTVKVPAGPEHVVPSYDLQDALGEQ